mgnify:FL=1
MPEGVGYGGSTVAGRTAQDAQRANADQRNEASRQEQQPRQESRAQTAGVEVQISNRAREAAGPAGPQPQEQSDTYADPRGRRS